MTTFTWTINNCENEVATGGITVAHWRVVAEDGDYTASSYGTVGFSPNASDSGFIAYDSVTEATVLGWVYGVINKAETEAALQGKIDADKTPTTDSGTPW
eukprot:GHVU01014195.1.p3 GENE.GHVU01014195.1~~GHVU01014195.1.p3  ORF type:complete len:100 (-),score=6.53 GHVU01014195.1:822-1121(-)